MQGHNSSHIPPSPGRPRRKRNRRNRGKGRRQAQPTTAFQDHNGSGSQPPSMEHDNNLHMVSGLAPTSDATNPTDTLLFQGQQNQPPTASNPMLFHIPIPAFNPYLYYVLPGMPPTGHDMNAWPGQVANPDAPQTIPDPRELPVLGSPRMPLTDEDARQLRIRTGMPPNYNGDPKNPFNHSAKRLPDSLNCSFWATNLPKDVTVKEICDAIRDCGRISAIHISRGETYPGGKKKYAAAKIIFVDLKGAQMFFLLAVLGRAPGFIVRGRRAYVERNRHKVPPQLGLPRNHTRVLYITGHYWIANPSYLTQFLESHGIVFQLESTVELPRRDFDHPDLRRLELRFARYSGQARRAYLALQGEAGFRRLSPPLRVDFDDDPCDVRVLERGLTMHNLENRLEACLPPQARFPTFWLCSWD